MTGKRNGDPNLRSDLQFQNTEGLKENLKWSRTVGSAVRFCVLPKKEILITRCTFRLCLV